MTNDTIKAVAEALAKFYGWDDPHAEYKGRPAYMNCWEEAKAAIEAYERANQYKNQAIEQATVTIPRQTYEAMQIREMSVEEVARVLELAYNDYVDYLGDSAMERYCNDAIMSFAARALTKLGTIKIVGEV